MTHYGVVANDRDCEFWEFKRLEDGLSGHDRVDEFDLVFEMGMHAAVGLGGDSPSYRRPYPVDKPPPDAGDAYFATGVGKG
jgi:hypothetical protein